MGIAGMEEAKQSGADARDMMQDDAVMDWVQAGRLSNDRRAIGRPNDP